MNYKSINKKSQFGVVQIQKEKQKNIKRKQLKTSFSTSYSIIGFTVIFLFLA